MTAHHVHLAAGAAYVVFSFAHQFNTPATNRSSTTWGRYACALSLYLAAALAAYGLLVWSFPELVAFLAGGAFELPDDVKGLSLPLLAALCLTTFMPRLPVLSAVDGALRGWLQRLATIPTEVRRLCAELRERMPEIAASAGAEVRRSLLDEGFDAAELRSKAGRNELLETWVALTALLAGLARWSSDPRMATYAESPQGGLEALRARRAGLAERARTAFRLLRETAAPAESEKAREAARHYAADLGGQVAALRDDVLDWMARGVLVAERTEGGRRTRLASLGFEVREARPGTTWNDAIALFLVISVPVLATFAFAIGRLPGASAGVVLGRAVFVALSYTTAVACAVWPKERWGFARREPGRPRPFAFYLLAGGLAVLVTQALAVALSCLTARDLAAGLARWAGLRPFALLTFAAAFGTAFLVDDRPWGGLTEGRLRAAEALAGAAILALAAVYVHSWLEGVRGPVPLGPMLALASAVGAAIGGLVPHWYRVAPRRGELASPAPA